jgi:uncharacterized protein (TIGR02246 family)
MEQTSTGTGQQAVDASLESTLRRFYEAFNRLDAKTFATFWADDGTLWNPLGHYAEGRAGVEKLFRQDGMKMYEGATTRQTITGARRVRDDCVLLDVENDIQNFKRADGTRGDLKLHVTILAQKRGESWQWLDVRAFGFMPPPPSIH